MDTPETNEALDLLRELVTKADSLYVPVKRRRRDGPYAPRSLPLDSPDLPLADAVRFLRDRISELVEPEPE